MSGTPGRLVLSLILAGLVALVAIPLISDHPVGASSRGRTGASGNPATGGQTCARCHSGGVAPEVALTGPRLVSLGATNMYTLTIRGGQNVAGGFDVSTTDGTLLALLGATDVQALEGEVTHTGAKPVDTDGAVSFRFLWSAPDTAGPITLYGAGNSVNGDGRTSGDGVAAVTLGILVEGGATPTAAPTEPTPPPTPYPVYADNLANPHGISPFTLGRILIGEGGTRGDAWQPGQFGPGAGDGRILSVDFLNPAQRTVLVDHMTNSVDPGGGVVGGNYALPVRIGTAGTSTATVALVAQAGGPAHTRPDDAAKILAVSEDGQVSVFADPLAYEREHNPDGAAGESGIDSNPWRLVPGPDDRVYVVDAGANDILALDVATRALSTWAVFPELTPDQQAIPTGLAFAPGGRVAYVSLLGPFGPGTTEIRRLEDLNGDGDMLDDGEQTLLIGGLKTATDLAIAHGGHLFVTEIFPGTLSRINPACWQAGTPCSADAKVVVAAGLPAASALAFLPDGDALVTTTGQPNPDGPSLNTDRVVRIAAEQLVPPPTPTDTPTPAATATATPTPAAGRWTIHLPLLMQAYTRP